MKYLSVVPILAIAASIEGALSFSPRAGSSFSRKVRAPAARNDHFDVTSAEVSRSKFLSVISTVGVSLATPTTPTSSQAFDGGVGGLGKTKPETGVQFFSDVSAPVQNSAGIVTAELNVNNQPVLVSFQTPWPLLPSTSGLEARDLQNAESAFVQVVSDNVPSERPLSKSSMKKLLLTSVFAQQGKYGAYGAPTDVKIKPTDDPSSFVVSFTTLTPGMRESERQVLISYCAVGSSLVMLVTGTTTLRYKKQEAALQKVVASFSAVAAPSSRLR